MNIKSIYLKASALIILAAGFSNCNSDKKMEKELSTFIAGYEAKVKPLIKATNLSYWNASISGKAADYKKFEDLQIELSKIYTNKEDFATLKKIKESNAITDEILKRELEIIYNAYLGSQIDPKKLEELIKIQTKIEQKFSTFRAEVDGKKLSDNDIEEVLKTSNNSVELQNTWLAHKKVGKLVAQDVIELVKKRNAVAKELGFNNYHEMSLKLSEQDPKEIEKIFGELDNLTRDAFAKLKTEIDQNFVSRYKVKQEELMPWHYQNRFFQEAPQIYAVDLDTYYQDKDIVKITRNYYEGIGLPIDDMLAKSDLFEKPGKNQHAYCTDIDNEGDVRVLCNVKNNANWMGTMLHEYGHAVYDKNVDINLPYSLRQPAHTFTTEAIAMLFGRFSSNPQWLKDVVGISDEEKTKIADASFNSLRLQQLVFSRWAQVMYHFEKNLYENPDQDLNKLWWDLVEKYQMLKRPADRNEPDWASKIHIATVPCYYHNYLLGELLASQLYYYIADNVIKTKEYRNQSFVNNKNIGKYLREMVFVPGARYNWNEMIEKATGEKLTAKYYAKQFVN